MHGLACQRLAVFGCLLQFEAGVLKDVENPGLAATERLLAEQKLQRARFAAAKHAVRAAEDRSPTHFVCFKVWPCSPFLACSVEGAVSL